MLFRSMLGPLAHAEEIGSVDTVFKMIGPDHKIVVEAFDDPDVKNVTCYVSRADHFKYGIDRTNLFCMSQWPQHYQA